MTTTPPKPRGFAYMKLHHPERMTEIARNGGKAVRPEDRGFSKDRERASAAGKKGGSVSRRTKKAVDDAV